MNFSERTYSVLIVSASNHFTDAVKALLENSRYEPVRTVKSISEARRAAAEMSFDHILINSPLPDETGIRFAIDISSSRGTVVLLAVSYELLTEIFEKSAEHGVFTIPKPLSRNVLILALNWLASARERLRQTEKKTLSIEEKMEEIRLVNRAKWLLIGELKMDEPSAHRYIEKQAMDRCVSKGEVARGILRTYSAK
ncbi:MAG: response regulator [Lachnospiraceae bacterium]|nr:response regulator [Lachnospiraceae bacterium]